MGLRLILQNIFLELRPDFPFISLYMCVRRGLSATAGTIASWQGHHLLEEKRLVATPSTIPPRQIKSPSSFFVLFLLWALQSWVLESCQPAHIPLLDFRMKTYERPGSDTKQSGNYQVFCQKLTSASLPSDKALEVSCPVSLHRHGSDS